MNDSHYIRLKHKQFQWLTKLFVYSLVTLMCALLLNMYINIKGIIIIASIGVLSAIIISLVNFKTRKYSYLIENFIRSNNLLQACISSHGREKTEYYPTVNYMTCDNQLYLQWRLDGSKIGLKFRDLEQPLSDYLRTTCTNILEERGYITYIFELDAPKQDRIDSFEDLPLLEEGKIRLSNIIVDWKKCPHALFVGLTGSGKTQLAQMFMYSLRRQGVRIIYCDPKADIEMRGYCKTQDIMYYSNENEIAKVVRELEEEMRFRGQELENMNLEEAEFNPVYICFDELLAYSKIANKKTYEEVSNRLSSIVVQGRQKRVYLCAIMQRPDTTFIDGATRENFCIKVCMGHSSDTTYKMIFGSEFAHVKNLRNEVGSGLIYRLGIDSKPRELLVPFMNQ